MPKTAPDDGCPGKKGNWLVLRYREDARNDDGSMRRIKRSSTIGLAEGPEKLTRKQAQHEAWERVLRHVNAEVSCPQSMMTLRQYVTQKFEPEHVWALKDAGKRDYAYRLRVILPALGMGRRMSDRHDPAVRPGIIETGRSVQTASTCECPHKISSTMTMYFTGRNPRGEAGDDEDLSRRSPRAGPGLLASLSSPRRRWSSCHDDLAERG
jgi:hypothetical protein